MKQQLLIVLSVLVAVTLVGFFALSHWYLSMDYHIFAVLASDPTPAQVRQQLGEPNEVIPAGEELMKRGWPLPRVKRSAEIWVYWNRTGRNFYVSIDKEQDCIAYVFSSSS